jgi:hypothetical protein
VGVGAALTAATASLPEFSTGMFSPFDSTGAAETVNISSLGDVDRRFFHMSAVGMFWIWRKRFTHWER